MRISYVILMLLLACSRPSTQKLPDSVTIAGHGSGGLWFTTGNYTTGGHLGRLDLASGALSRSILPVGSDTQIFPDNGGLLLITRMNLDSVTSVQGSTGAVAGSYLLPSRVNPQCAARDSQGRVWVASQESNFVVILSADLSSSVGAVDLGSLSAPGETLADLAQVVSVDSNHMAVSAQRLHRTAGVWKPDAQSGVALVDESNLSASTQLLDVSNPVQMAASAGAVSLAGSGDLSSPDGFMARLVTLGAGLSVSSTRDISAKILGADYLAGSDPALIVWYVDENKSCVEVGSVQLVCDGTAANAGYVFGSIRRSADHVYVSYTGGNRAELWIVPVVGVGAGGVGVQRVPMDLPIQSLSFGP